MEQTINTDMKCMASLAVFRELYNSGKDIYDVIAEFAICSIYSRKLHSFELLEFCQILKEDFGLFVVSAVVKQALKRVNFITSNKTLYEVNDNWDTNTVNGFIQENESKQKEIEEVLDAFVIYVRGCKKGTLTLDDINNIKIDFCRYIIDKDIKDESNIAFISSFILKHNEDTLFLNKLNKIKEGLIIYHGLSYSINVEKVDVFDHEITFFLETEMLFYAGGLNGTVYQFLFDEFYKQVEQINKASLQNKGKRIIKLSYFEESKKEVERYFNIAELIVSGNQRLDSTQVAMAGIVNGCSRKADVKEKEVTFWKKIESLGILEDPKTYDYAGEVKKYNITIAKEENPTEKDLDILQMLTKINFLRRFGNAKYFKTCEKLLITGNGQTILFSKKFTTPGNVPLATTLGYVTNRLWFSLNNGMFTTNNSLTTHNIIAFAQISFSQKYNMSLLTAYEQIEKEYKDGKITRELAEENIAAYKTSMIQPDDAISIVEQDDSYLSVFDGSGIEAASAALQLERSQHQSQVESLQRDVNNAKKSISILLQEKNNAIQKQYQIDLAKYERQKSCFLVKRIIVRWFFSILYVILCLSVIIGLVLETIFDKLQSQYTIGGLIALGLLLALDKFTNTFGKMWTQKAWKWIFKKDIRQQRERGWIDEYQQHNPPPILQCVTEEDYK